MISFKTLKNKTIRYSGRSSDYIFPTLVQGCVGRCSYCYGSRHSNNFQGNLLISENIDEIIETVKNFTTHVIKPNQTHDRYITWDIGCNSDVSIDINHINWIKVFDYFKYSNRDSGTFATKFVNNKLLSYNPDRKIRVRLSLMPDCASKVFEKSTSSIKDRIDFINRLYNSGYEVHVNFSPVIYYNGWEYDYIELFKEIDYNLNDKIKEQLACEVIFLTHNESLHKRNVENSIEHEELLWNPSIQESKISGFGGKNVRYKYGLKNELVNKFRELINKELPYCSIRYIF